MRHSLIILSMVTAQYCFAATDYRPMVMGNWQCQSTVTTDYGDTLVLGELGMHDDGVLLGQGNLLFSYPSLNTEVPLAATLKAQWLFKDNKVFISQMTGDIISPYPLLNGVANSFKQEVLQQKSVSLQLTQIGKKFMALKAEDQTEIQCIRPSNE